MKKPEFGEKWKFTKDWVITSIILPASTLLKKFTKTCYIESSYTKLFRSKPMESQKLGWASISPIPLLYFFQCFLL